MLNDFTDEVWYHKALYLARLYFYGYAYGPFLQGIMPFMNSAELYELRAKLTIYEYGKMVMKIASERDKGEVSPTGGIPAESVALLVEVEIRVELHEVGEAARAVAKRQKKIASLVGADEAFRLVHEEIQRALYG